MWGTGRVVVVSHLDAVQLRIGSNMLITCVKQNDVYGCPAKACYWILMAVVVLGRQCGGGISHKI